MPLYRIVRKTISYSEVTLEAENSEEAIASACCERAQRLWDEADEFGHRDTYKVAEKLESVASEGETLVRDASARHKRAR